MPVKSCSSRDLSVAAVFAANAKGVMAVHSAGEVQSTIPLFVFILCCSTCLLIGECRMLAFVVLGLETGLGNVSEMTYFVSSGT